jgi:hypothetical protein
MAIAQNPMLAAVKDSNSKVISVLTLLTKFGLTISAFPAHKRPI